MDQIYQRSIVLTSGSEVAKLKRNELDDEFNEWKKETIKIFMENYPEDYKWQLEFLDWEGAMNLLSNIYHEEYFEKLDNEKPKRRNGK